MSCWIFVFVYHTNRPKMKHVWCSILIFSRCRRFCIQLKNTIKYYTGMWEFRYIAEFPLYFSHFGHFWDRCKSVEKILCKLGGGVEAKNTSKSVRFPRNNEFPLYFARAAHIPDYSIFSGWHISFGLSKMFIEMRC